jgi:transcriptional regulator with XRE-family HTH domain
MPSSNATKPQRGRQLPSLKAWREYHALTQRELAAEAGVGAATIARLETGSATYPSTIRKLARALKVKPEDLLDKPSST